MVFVNLGTPSGTQGISLQVEVLVVGGDSGVADQHF
jgi:hypothetical protein